VQKMYDMYKAKHPDHKISYESFWRYFKENFDLKFGQPQQDTCVTCEELGLKTGNKSLNDNARRTAVAELIVHKRRSKKFYNCLKAETEDKSQTTAAIAIDFMANISLPIIPVQDLYYYRKLTVSVFGIHNLKDGTMVCYVYHEGEGGKGPNEVVSLLSHYIETYILSDPNVKKLKIFADNCAGQNKNNPITRFIMALVEVGKFDSVELLYPIRGHSFMPCDRDFSLIKRKLRKIDRLYLIEEILDVIRSASINPAKFQVHLLSHDAFLDFNNWWPIYYKKTCLSNSSFGINVPKERKKKF
jgi:hypothetical protein